MSSMKIHETRTSALYSNPEVGEVRDVRKNKLVDLINKEDACSLLSLNIFFFSLTKWQNDVIKVLKHGMLI